MSRCTKDLSAAQHAIIGAAVGSAEHRRRVGETGSDLIRVNSGLRLKVTFRFWDFVVRVGEWHPGAPRKTGTRVLHGFGTLAEAPKNSVVKSISL